MAKLDVVDDDVDADVVFVVIRMLQSDEIGWEPTSLRSNDADAKILIISLCSLSLSLSLPFSDHERQLLRLYLSSK